MILVTGSAGQLGNLVIKSLLRRVPANQIVATVRDIKNKKATDLEDLGVIVVEADYEKPEQWPIALKGVDKVLIITSSIVEKRQQHAAVVIKAAKDIGTVKLIAYTSLLHIDKSMAPFAEDERKTERLMRESGIQTVMLRHTWYTENYADFAGPAAEYGILYGAAKDGRISGATRADLAEAAAQVLTSNQPLKPSYELAGDTSFTLEEVAAEISKQTGKIVKYVDLPEAELADYFLQIGYPKEIADLLAAADTAVSRGELYDESHDLSRLTGRATTPLSAAVKTSLLNTR